MKRWAQKSRLVCFLLMKWFNDPQNNSWRKLPSTWTVWFGSWQFNSCSDSDNRTGQQLHSKVWCSAATVNCDSNQIFAWVVRPARIVKPTKHLIIDELKYWMTIKDQDELIKRDSNQLSDEAERLVEWNETRRPKYLEIRRFEQRSTHIGPMRRCGIQFILFCHC